MNLAKKLSNRYDIVTASKTEQDFYMNVYQYYDYIFKNPDLYNIYIKSGHEYRRKAVEIWKDYDKSNLDKCSHQTQLASKMEKGDMYCNGVGLEVRLYQPLKDYYETNEPDMLQDPHAVALVKGIEYASKVCAKRYPDNDVKGIKKSFNNWFKDQRDDYQQDLSTFHILFLSEIEKLDGAVTIPESNEISFDPQKSILFLGDKEVKVSLQNNPPVEHFILEYIFENDGVGERAYFTEILEEKFDEPKENFRKILRACQNLDRKIQDQTGLKDILVYGSGMTATVCISPPR